jgi:hypothetical protein
MSLVYYQEAERPVERFSFFIIVEDDDGTENLDELYLYHDREGLRWRMTSKDWIYLEHEGKSWIGSRAISMPGGAVLPRGQYRAVLINKGGERTERAFAFDAPEKPRYPFPVFTITEGRYVINSRYPTHYFLGYDARGEFIKAVAVQRLDGTIESLNLPSNVKSIALWADDEVYHTSALTDVSSLEEKLQEVQSPEEKLQEEQDQEEKSPERTLPEEKPPEEQSPEERLRR